MSNKFIIPAPPFVGGSVASGVATCDLPVGPRYHVAWLKLTTTTDATPILSEAIGQIRVKINGRTQRQFTATQLNAYNSIMGAEFFAYLTTAAAPNVIVAAFDSQGNCKTVTGGLITATAYTTAAAHILHLPIFFSEPFRKQYASGDLPAWPTSWGNGKSAVATFQIEVTLGTNASPNLTAEVEIDYEQGMSDAQGNPILLISKFNQYAMTGFATGAWNYLTTLPRKDVYQSLHFFADNASDKVTPVQVKLENNLIRDVNKARLDLVDIARGINPVAIVNDRTDVFFDYDDMPSSGLPMVYGGRQVQDFQVICKKEGATDGSAPNATTASILAVTFGPLD